MSIIETKIKNAFGQYQENGNLLKLVKDIAHIGDYSVNSQTHAAIMYDAIRAYCPKQLFECVYYDGEHSKYHLFDFDPNQLESEALNAAVRISLEHECYIDPENIDRAMESVYLLNSNSLVKVVTK